MTIQDFIEKHRISAVVEATDTNPAMPDFDGDHWRVTLRRGRKQMLVYFSKGIGHKGAPPTTEEVLECLRSDSFSPDNFPDFCSEYGYDEDSRRAYATFNAVRRQNKRLERFLGELVEELQSCEE